MAVSHSGRMVQMTAAADNTSSIFGADANLLVSAIGIQWTGASSTCTLKQTNTSGPIILSFTPAGTSSTTLITFGSPMYFNNVYVAALPANHTVTIYLV